MSSDSTLSAASADSSVDAASTDSAVSTPNSANEALALIEQMAGLGASDLHYSTGSPPVLRVDGLLVPQGTGQPLSGKAVMEAAELLLGPKSFAQFCEGIEAERTASVGSGRVRVSAFHQRIGPALAIRWLNERVPEPAELGLPPALVEVVTRPHGLVLVTGPTGAGKTTTMAALIGHISRQRKCHILTVEDPIEYLHGHGQGLVSQREVGTHTDSFASALRAALREDPDVVVVGEMRDLESISLALTLAETGHLVLGSIHTNDAAQTVDRIVDVFPAAQQDQIRTQLGLTLSAVCSQRLIPRIAGGRVAACELMLGTPAVANLIREQKSRQIRNVMLAGTGDGMQVLEQSLAELVIFGTVSHENAIAHSVHRDELEKMLALSAPRLAVSPGGTGADAGLASVGTTVDA